MCTGNNAQNIQLSNQDGWKNVKKIYLPIEGKNPIAYM